jgi:L-alanine-DL-glutamate epimerase-like enolase superfamily enzyme
MKITSVESLHANAGQRNFDFLKIGTDEGIVGWSEYNESFGGLGVSAVIDGLVPQIVGKDPRAYESLVTLMYAVRRQAAGGVVQQAIGAIENALLDIKAKALGVPVYELFGGPVRDRIRLYWSHCGTYRLQWAAEMEIPPLRTLDDVVAAGREVVARGYTGLKTNVFMLGKEPHLHSPGFARRGPNFPDLNAERPVLQALRDQLAAFRQGAGPDVDILVDLNFNFKTEGFLKVARAIEPFDIFWVEIDTRDAKALAYIRQGTRIPVASCECLFGRRDYRPYLERSAVDVAIIDTPWNGVAESLKIAAMADAYEVNVAPHNFYGHLATFMNAHFCAVAPNLRIMEIDPDTVPWYDDLVTEKPEIKDGHLFLPTRPGWGTEVNEEAVRAHPPRRRA